MSTSQLIGHAGQRLRMSIFFPEMPVAARAMQAGMILLKPHLVETGIESAGKVAIGTVNDDLHDTGKNLTAMMLVGVLSQSRGC